jgi:hypothetical protein
MTNTLQPEMGLQEGQGAEEQSKGSEMTRQEEQNVAKIEAGLASLLLIAILLTVRASERSKDNVIYNPTPNWGKPAQMAPTLNSETAPSFSPDALPVPTAP